MCEKERQRDGEILNMDAMPITHASLSVVYLFLFVSHSVCLYLSRFLSRSGFHSLFFLFPALSIPVRFFPRLKTLLNDFNLTKWREFTNARHKGVRVMADVKRKMNPELCTQVSRRRGDGEIGKEKKRKRERIKRKRQISVDRDENVEKRREI